jgi:hypothetical protein
MESKQGGDACAFPDRAGGTLQQDEQQQGVAYVQQHACQVVPHGIESEQLDVQHVRKPGQGMPVVKI